MSQRATPQQLRDQILLSLQAGKAQSVTHLAEELGAHRSSVSRTVNGLISAGLVAREGRTLILTEDGRGMAKSVLESIPAKTIESTAKIYRLAERHDQLLRIAAQQNPMMIEAARMQELVDRFVLPQTTIQDLATQQLQLVSSSLVRDIVIPPTLLFKTDHWDQLRQQLSQLAGQYNAWLNPMVDALSTSEMIQAAFKGLADVQLLHTGWQENAAFISPAIPQVGDLLARNGAIVNRMMSDLAAIAAAKPSGILDSLSRSVAETVRSYQNYMVDVPAILNASGAPITFKELSWGIYLPTTTTSCLVTATRHNIELDRGGYDERSMSRTELGQVRTQNGVLEGYIDGLPSRFQQQWQGAWHALESESPDCIRQSAHSARELLIQVLDYYAPDNCFTDDEINRDGHMAADGRKRPTRRMKIRYILGSRGGTAVDFVDAFAKTLDKLYDVLCKEAHSRSDIPYSTVEDMSCLLITLEGLMAFLLASQHGK